MLWCTMVLWCATTAARGDVVEVKVLGVLAMVDDGETDWKVLLLLLCLSFFHPPLEFEK